MPISALFIVLAAACAHAAWNIIAHGASNNGAPFLWWGAFISAALWSLAIPFTGGLFWSDGDAQDSAWGGLIAGVCVSAFLHVLYMFVLQRGYAAGDLSTVYATARGTGPLITVLVAIAFLGERPGIIALAGVAAIIAGVVAMGVIGRPVHAPIQDQRRRPMDPGLFYGLLTGVMIATYTLWDTHAVRSWELSPVAFMVGCTAFQLPVFAAMIGRAHAFNQLMPTLREGWPRLLAFGILSPLSYILVLYAVTIAPVSLVAPVRESSVILVSLFGALVHKESRPAARIAASIVVVGGLVLLNI